MSAQESALLRMVEEGRLSSEQLERARSLGSRDPERRGPAYHLVDQRILSPSELQRALGVQFGMETADPLEFPLTPEIAPLLPRALACGLRAVALSVQARTVHVAVDDPYNLDASAEIRERTGLDVRLYLTDEHSLWKRIGELPEELQPQLGEDVGRMAMQAASEIEQQKARVTRSSRVMENEVERSWIPQLLDRIMRDGVQRGASDIHVEFSSEAGRVRYRVDGALVEWDQRLDARLEEDLIARIKVISDLDSANRRRPQDGKAQLRVANRTVEFRVSTLPTVRGEKAVLRILDHAAPFLEMEQLGLEESDERRLRRTLQKNQGMVLVTGPTGSGKTTTLYSILHHLNRPSQNIITVEDPVEREIAGITQVNVRPSTDLDVDLSYASVLRGMLRQDPNILMVGEVRDPETAQIAARAAITGHLVLSTLHTNDAPGAVARLLDFGLEPYNIVGALRLVIAQRLVRRLCPRCREATEPDPELLEIAGTDPAHVSAVQFYRPAGCGQCSHTGFRGRVGIFEMMELNERIRPLVLTRRSEQEIRAGARAGHMIPLREAGWRRVRQGLTTLDEILKET